MIHRDSHTRPPYTHRLLLAVLVGSVILGPATVATIGSAGCRRTASPEGDTEPPTSATPAEQLLAAAEAANAAAVRSALADGADPDTLGPGGVPLACLCAGTPDVLGALLEFGAEPMATDGGGRTPLHWAGIADEPRSIHMLLEHEADVAAQSSANGATPLHSAAWYGSTSAVNALLAADAEVGAQAHDGSTPLHWASQESEGAVVDQLLSAGAEVDARDEVGQTPLHWACGVGPASTVRRLLTAGADPGATGSDGRTALHVAAQEGRSAELLRLLVDSSADVDARCAHGSTPLMLAAGEDRAQTVEALLALGARTDLRDDFGRDALAIAEDAGAREAVAVLVRELA